MKKGLLASIALLGILGFSTTLNSSIPPDRKRLDSKPYTASDAEEFVSKYGKFIALRPTGDPKILALHYNATLTKNISDVVMFYQIQNSLGLGKLVSICYDRNGDDKLNLSSETVWEK